MSTSKTKSQVRAESRISSVGGFAKAATGRGRRNAGVVSLYTTALLPSASGAENGLLAYDTTTAELKITVSGSWVVIA